MQIVIELDDKDYELVTKKYPEELSGDFIEYIFAKIENGTVLSEHHGRLIDADALECEPYLVSKGNGMYEEVKGYFNIDDAPTILEATEEHKE